MAYSSCPNGLSKSIGKSGETYQPCPATFGRSKGKDKFYYGKSTEIPTVNEDNFRTSLLKEREFRKMWETEPPPPREPGPLQGSSAAAAPQAIEIEHPDDVHMLEVGELRQQCRALGLSTAGRREDLAAALTAIVGQRRSAGRITRQQANRTSNNPHSEAHGKAMAATLKTIKQRAHDTWHWDVPQNWQEQVAKRDVARAQTSAPGTRNSAQKRSEAEPMLVPPGALSRRVSSRPSTVGSGVDKAALKAVLESNQRLMGQIGNIRTKLSHVNNVIDSAEVVDSGAHERGFDEHQGHATSARGSVGSWVSSEPDRSQRSVGQALGLRRLTSRSVASQRTQSSAPTVIGTKSYLKRGLPRAKTPLEKQYITSSARRKMGAKIPLQVAPGIPGAQKMGVQRGAGENGCLRGDGKTTVTFCPAPASLSHRMGSMHRTHNMKALGDVWRTSPDLLTKLTPFHSFNLKNTRHVDLKTGAIELAPAS